MTTQTIPEPTSTKGNALLGYEASPDFKQCGRCDGAQITPQVVCDVALLACENPDCGHFVRYSLHPDEKTCSVCGSPMHVQPCGGDLHSLVTHD